MARKWPDFRRGFPPDQEENQIGGKRGSGRFGGQIGFGEKKNCERDLQLRPAPPPQSVKSVLLASQKLRREKESSQEGNWRARLLGEGGEACWET